MSEYYFELIIKPNEQYPAFLDLIYSLCDEAIEENEGTLIIRSEEDLSNIEFGIKEFAKAINVNCEITLEKKENIDWIKKYQQSVKPILIDNFYIRPSWEEEKKDKINIIINPALSFGSGHHETTHSCVKAISKYIKSKDSVLDVGTGSGILAIAAAKLDAKVDICDTDEVCVNDTKSNFELNNTNFNNSWIGSANNAQKKYDVVIANIVADVLIFISNDLKKCLNDNGILIISGILDKHIDRVLNKFKNLQQLEVIEKNEWVSVVFQNIKNKGSHI